MQWLIYSATALVALMGFVMPGSDFDGVSSIDIDNTYFINNDGELTFNESTLNASAGDLFYYNLTVNDPNVTVHFKKG